MQIVLADASPRHPAAKGDVPDAVRHLTLSVKAGEHVAVIGPSGAGKTTQLQLLACALKPTTGKLHLGDIEPWALSVADLQKIARHLVFSAAGATLAAAPTRGNSCAGRALAANGYLGQFAQPVLSGAYRCGRCCIGTL